MENKIIVALDYSSEKEALAFVDSLDPSLCRVKVGKALFVAAGPAIIEKIKLKGFDIFLDLKFHDIPNTVAGACRSAAELGVWMLTVHASGGEAMLAAACDAVSAYENKPLIVGVTVLTSLSDDDAHTLGWQENVDAMVLRLAQLAKRSGIDGVVCSPKEVEAIKATCGKTFLAVTPGVRFSDDSAQDQKRVMTPLAAFAAGSDYLVMGRSITQASDPIAALKKAYDK